MRSRFDRLTSLLRQQSEKARLARAFLLQMHSPRQSTQASSRSAHLIEIQLMSMDQDPKPDLFDLLPTVSGIALMDFFGRAATGAVQAALTRKACPKWCTATPVRAEFHQ